MCDLMLRIALQYHYGQFSPSLLSQFQLSRRETSKIILQSQNLSSEKILDKYILFFVTTDKIPKMSNIK